MNVCTALFLEREHEVTAGILPETYFKCSAVSDLVYPWYDKAYERQQTEVRLAWSNKFLYVHFWALDGYVFARETKAKGRVDLDDFLGVYVSREPGSYLGWEVNALGALSEFQVRYKDTVRESDVDKSWRSAVVSKTARYPGGWALELRIPFDKDFTVRPGRGDSWRVAFHRNDVDKQGRISLSTWTTPEAEALRFHSPSTFGELVFG